MNHTSLPWTVYQCQFAKEEPGSACGLNGRSFDCSYEECHHPLDLADAAYIVQACNAFPKLVEALEAANQMCLANGYGREWVQPKIAEALALAKDPMDRT